MRDLFALVGLCVCDWWVFSWGEVKAVCLCVFLFWWCIHRHLRIPLTPLSLVHVRLAKPPEPNIHPERSILAQSHNTLSKLSVVEDDPQCSRTFGISQRCVIQITPCWVSAFFLCIWRSEGLLQNKSFDAREEKESPAFAATAVMIHIWKHLQWDTIDMLSVSSSNHLYCIN